MPLPHGERSTSPSANTVTFRWTRLALALPEDDAVDVPQLGLERMDELVLRLELALELAAALDQPRQLRRLDALLDRCVEGAAERDVDSRQTSVPQTNAGTLRKRTETHAPSRTRATVSSRPDGTSTTTRVSSSRDQQHPRFERPRDERDRAVPARRRVAGVVEEHDAEIGAVVLRLGDEAAVHVGVAARLVDEQLPQMIEPLGRVAALLEDRVPAQLLPGHDAERLAPVW